MHTVRPGASSGAAGALQDALRDGKVAVVAGFQGVTADGEVTTLGGGGSDDHGGRSGRGAPGRWVEISCTDVDG